MGRCTTAGVVACIVLVLCLATSIVRSSTIVGPVDTAAELYQQATIPCTATYTDGDARTQWNYYPTGGPSVKIFDSANPTTILVPGFAIDSDVAARRYDLVITNATMDKGVLYDCQTDLMDVSKHAEFIVLEPMQCPASGQPELVEGTEIIVECSVNYRGAIAPVLTWTDDNVLNMTSELQQTQGRVAAVMNITLGPEHDDLLLTCLLDFNSTSDYPEFTNNCTTFYYVLHNVTEIDFEPPGDDNGYLGRLPVDTNITCIAGGRPAPDFQWVDATDGTVVSESDNLTVNIDMVQDDPVYYTCIASNTVQGIKSTQERNISFIAYVGDDVVVQSGVETWVIIVAVVVPVVVLTAAGIAGYFIYRHHKNKDKKKKKNTTTTPQTASSANAQSSHYDPGASQPLMSSNTNPGYSAYPPTTSSIPLTTPSVRNVPSPAPNGNYGLQPGPPRPGDRNSAGFADLGGSGPIPGPAPIGTTYNGSSNRIYSPNPAVNMQPNPIRYPYQPPQSVTGTGAGSVRQQSGSSTGSHTPSVYGHPTGPVPVGYAPSVSGTSHHSSLV